MRRVIGLGVGAGVGLLLLAACQKSPDAASTGDQAAAGEAGPAAAPGGAMTPPRRKSGLWAISTTAMGRDQTIRTCVDQASDAEMAAWGQGAAQEDCTQNKVKPVAGGGWEFESVCTLANGGGTVTSHGTATGDFSSKYVVKVHSTTQGSSMPQADGEHDMQMTATWEGPCPADMKPGDMLLPGGVKISADTMRSARGR
jgi:hypothetical protein